MRSLPAEEKAIKAVNERLVRVKSTCRKSRELRKVVEVQVRRMMRKTWQSGCVHVTAAEDVRIVPRHTDLSLRVHRSGWSAS